MVFCWNIIKVGDKVQVYRKLDSDAWLPKMMPYLNRIGKVEQISSAEEFGTIVLVRFPDVAYWFDARELKKVRGRIVTCK